jgi:hypothetical protein
MAATVPAAGPKSDLAQRAISRVVAAERKTIIKLDSRRSGRPWQAFRYTWNATESGEHLVITRAYDATGACQPDDLHINQIHRVRALVAA